MANYQDAILQMKINSILKEIRLKTGAKNVVVDEATGETLEARLTALAQDIADAVAGGLKTSDVQAMIDTAVDNIVNGAPEALNQLNEIVEYIQAHEEVADQLSAAIANKVDKVDGMGLSANDFTDALLAKLNGIQEGATKVEASSTNGNVKINGTETKVYTHASHTAHAEGLYKVTVDAEGHVSKATEVTKQDIVDLGIPSAATVVSKSDVNGSVKVDGTDVQVYQHPTGAGNEHLPSGGAVGQVLRATGSGKGAWGDAIRSGESAPSDLAEGELFLQFISETTV